MAYDLLFTNARVVDGTGSPWLRADVAVADGRIVAVGRELHVEAARTIDVENQILAPGFYDMHSHADISLLVDPRHEPKLFQGVTFELLGQDGLSYAPVTPELREQVRRHLAGLNGDDPRAGWDWTSVGSYLDRFDGTTSVNVGYLVPHNAVRIGAMGWEMRTATAAELDRMRGLVREGMEDGAFGLSTALTYPPNMWSDTDEMVAICEVVARYGGIYVTHLRGQGDALLDPIREAIEICRRAGLPLHISHLKSSRLGGPTNLPGLLDLMNGARADGLDLTFDSYQYNCGSGMLHAQLPDWTHAGGPDVEKARLRSSEVRDKIREQWVASPPDWDRIVLASVPSKANRWMEGRTLGSVIADSNRDAVDVICDLLLEEDLGVSHVSIAGDDDDPHLGSMLEVPYQMAGSDGLHLGSKLHPRTYGTYARVLQRYVREQKLLRLEEAIRKLASYPARRLSISDRGEIREGMWADLVVFDEQTIAEHATYPEPMQLATGVSYVAVNGTLVLDAGRHTGATPGRALRHRAWESGVRSQEIRARS
ncbi:MAG TPA: D-aminoacylase [Chloroflexota bacterium]|nr:D-aminoacylase [Chloroflexota bacterium]